MSQAVQTNLGGVKMELEDATYPLLKVRFFDVATLSPRKSSRGGILSCLLKGMLLQYRIFNCHVSSAQKKK